MSKRSDWLKQARLTFGIILIAALAGCATYEEPDYYGPYDYYDGWYPDSDVYVFGGPYVSGSYAYAYSHRGWGSRGGWHGGGGHYGGGHYGGGGGHFGGGGHGGGGHGGGGHR